MLTLVALLRSRPRTSCVYGYMDRLDAPAIAKLMIEIGQRISLAGENPYKARAYTRAAESLVAVTVPLDELIARDRLQEIPGIGAAIAATIRELQERGTTSKLEQLRSEIPEGVLGMLRIPGIKPDKILQIYRLFGTASLEELESACRQDQLRGHKGLGPALQDRILSGIELHRKSQGQRLIHAGRRDPGQDDGQSGPLASGVERPRGSWRLQARMRACLGPRARG